MFFKKKITEENKIFEELNEREKEIKREERIRMILSCAMYYALYR